MQLDTTQAADNLAKALAELRPEIRAMLAEDLPEEQRLAEQAYGRQDWPSLQEHIHRLHGTALFCRLDALKILCAGIENGLKQHHLPSADAMSALAAEINRILASTVPG
jgi:HPt (histidine-containing phosphotransfer) domain-containing protein